MKSFQIIISCILLLAACSSSTEYEISGIASQDENGKYVYMLRNGNFRYGEGNTQVDSALVENGRFRFVGNIIGDSIRFISASNSAVTFILEPGVITLDFSNPSKLGGTPLNEALNRFSQEMEALNEKYSKLFKDLMVNKTGNRDQLIAESRQARADLCKSVIRVNKNNSLGEYVLWSWLIGIEDVKNFDMAYAELECRPLNYRPLIGLIMRFEEMRKTAPGTMFTDFTIPNGNLDGTPASLSDYVGKGKYVLVDFWASWCGWCRAEFPVLKEVYEKYKGDHFELLGIVVNDKEERTRKAMEEDGVYWPQIINTGEKAMHTYGVAGIPEIILFDPEGKILARGLRGDALKAKVAEELAKVK